jgi:hypothetical protein
VISYLDIKKENFYRVETTVDGLSFATARGWEDLSELICAYEKLGLQVDRAVVEQYMQMPAIARDFANYLMLYYKYQKTYHVDDILRGEWEIITESELRAAAFDERLSVLGLLISRLSDTAGGVRRQDELTQRGARIADPAHSRGSQQRSSMHGRRHRDKQRAAAPAADVVEVPQRPGVHIVQRQLLLAGEEQNPQQPCAGAQIADALEALGAGEVRQQEGVGAGGKEGVVKIKDGAIRPEPVCAFHMLPPLPFVPL